ncbi:MAG TPA: NAD(P)/FAD-dependent oxidoreductase [Terriglobia bacterium]|nr:NAD(P)/FAD-dependent oxidoreductase [Terriglobia bacterium]
MSTRKIKTLVVGGGQAGLAISYDLKQRRCEHVVFERAPAVANAWRNQRWDSFTLVTPNFQVRMPGAEYDGDDPYGFMSRSEVVKYFDDYVARFRLPVQCGMEVTGVHQTGHGYLVNTSEGDYESENVVIATGLFQSPKIPTFSASIPSNILQIHSMEYRNPSELPPGAVLVVGTGQSGAQIAEELYQNGRKVYLSIGAAGRLPRRYRGRDITDWFTRIGTFDAEVGALKSPRDKFTQPPVIYGRNGRGCQNLHQFAREGVRLLGHLRDVDGDRLVIASDMNEMLAKADQFEIDGLKIVDEYIARSGMDVPTDEIPRLSDGYEPEETTELGLKASGISAVIWATGYTFDFSVVKLPVVDGDGYPIQQRGVTEFVGLYFLGMPWLHSRKSGLLFGVGDDAAYIAGHIAGRVRTASGSVNR